MIRSLHTSARPGLVSTKTRIEPKTVKDVAGLFCKGYSARTGYPSHLYSRTAVPRPVFIDDFAHSTRNGRRTGA